ncbi:MAG: zf-HC2 domain-containing protein [Acidobacteriota bacterium]|nr:zf-HC2 domain-containing protein [Acidobacteriota bacterium]
MTCDTWQPKIDAYLDNELPEADVRDVASHLRSCASCSSEALARSELKRSIHLAAKSYVPDPEFRKRIQNTVSPKVAGRSWNWAWTAGTAFAMILLVIAGSLLWTRQIQQQQIIGELTDLHVATLASANRVEVVSSDRHTVKPWFQGKVPFTFNVPELQGSQFELIGGKVTYLDQNPGAELLFGVRKHLLSVFIFKDSPELDRALGSNGQMRKLSFNLASWSDNGLRYLVVTDAARSDVNDLHARFAEAAR